MQRNHSAVDVMRIDISGPPDVGGEAVSSPRIFCAPALRWGFSFGRGPIARADQGMMSIRLKPLK